MNIIIKTVQGIGDIFWSYQKIAPHFKLINLNILCVDTNIIQKRAHAFCRMLPNVVTVSYVRVPWRDYDRVAKGHYKLDSVRANAPGPVEYAVNAPLEIGTNLRDLDGGAEIAEFVDMGLPATVQRGDYLCVFVAGGKNPATWQPREWIPHIERLAKRLETRDVRLIGASWDVTVQAEIGAELKRRQYDVSSYVGADLPTTIDIIRRSRFFLGYQSGLNVIAENYNVPQLIIYFQKLRPMLYTWCKPASVRTIFHATTFGDNVAAVIDGLPLEHMIETVTP